MLKKNKGLLIITSIVVLLPILVGVALWDQLPDTMAIHWNAAGEADGWADKGKAVVMLPLILLGAHWVCVTVMSMDPKSKNMQDKMWKLALWVCPLISLLVSAATLGSGLGWNIPVEIVMPMLLGVLFICIGNYMPKCKQTYTMGIRLPWTLDSEENWNKTHRFAGKVWVVGGVLMMLSSLIGKIWIIVATALCLALLPSVYSYWIYRQEKQRQEEE